MIHYNVLDGKGYAYLAHTTRHGTSSNIIQYALYEEMSEIDLFLIKSGATAELKSLDKRAFVRYPAQSEDRQQ